MDAPIDLRSDTVSKPSAAMRRAMATAEVGDDRYGDDPTVKRLQDLAAEGVLVSIAGGRVRMLTHVGVSAGDITAAVGAWQRAAATAGLGDRRPGLAGRE